ncbi:MAG TPA: hypothetical protein VLG45_01040, partial [Thermodesulfobacteriota bacterium]|nr:hypothetical protein [Thermodesulfobacteriota bacterium]
MLATVPSRERELKETHLASCIVNPASCIVSAGAPLPHLAEEPEPVVVGLDPREEALVGIV